MKLHDWMARVAKTPDEIAEVLDVTGEAVRRYARGARMPRPEICKRIHELTGGAVTAQDLYERRLEFLNSATASAA